MLRWRIQPGGGENLFFSHVCDGAILGVRQTMAELKSNEGKNATIEVDGNTYLRLPIKTHVVTAQDKMPDVAEKYAKEHMQPGDILFISEKCVACSQKRAVPLTEIHPRRLARFLCKFVYKSPYGIGLGIPETMEMAIRECGTLRLLFAAFISAIGKLFRQRGWFYKVAGYKAESIDGPTPYTLPPYNKCVVLGPEDPDKVAREISERIGFQVAIVDVNDLAGKILGVSDQAMDREYIARILKDNPLGQSAQQTPMGIIRQVQQEDAAQPQKASEQGAGDVCASDTSDKPSADAEKEEQAQDAQPEAEASEYAQPAGEKAKDETGEDSHE